MKKTLAVSLIAASLTVAGCATDPNNTQKGAAIGAVVGALLGKATGDNDKSRYAWGAAVGAIAGGAIGNYMDKQEEELRILQEAFEQKLIAEEEYARRRVEVNQTASDDIQRLQTQLLNFQLNSASDTFGKLAAVKRVVISVNCAPCAASP